MTPDKRDALLELLLEPVIIASTYMGDDKRPLAEMTAPRSLREGVAFEMRRCPYSGSRNGKPMNLSALRVLSLGMKACINDTIRLRRAYLQYLGRQSFDLASFWRFTRVLDSIPVYLVRRRREPLCPATLPSRLSTMFKAAQGLHLAPEVMILDPVSLETPVTTAALYDLIEERDLFMDDGRACAGPPPMVEGFVDSAVTGAGTDQGDDWMFELLGEPEAEGLFQYSDAVSDLFVAKARLEAESRLETLQLLAELDEPSLRATAKEHMSRFGFFRDNDRDRISGALANFRALSSLPEQSSQALGDVPPRFIEMLQLRNPEKAPAQVDIAARRLWMSTATESRWHRCLEALQERVLRALGRELDTELTSRDLVGTGYTLREVLSAWLRVEMVHGRGRVILKAGASTEDFALRHQERVQEPPRDLVQPEAFA